jgi:hypothetical protein
MVRKENMRIRKAFAFMMCISVLLSFLVFLQISRIEGVEANADESFPLANYTQPKFTDFSINDTRCSAVAQWNYSLTDSYGLKNATFWWNNGTNDMGNTTYTFSGSPLSGNVIFNFTLPSLSENVTFQCWTFNAYDSGTTGIRWMLVYPSNIPNPYFLNLGTAISTVDNANNWNTSDTYDQLVLGKKNTSDLTTMIDNYAAAKDWVDVLKWSAICNKLGITQQHDIEYALGNYTMVGSVPFTYQYGAYPTFMVENSWALYGYWYANTTWYQAYSGYDAAQWNITAAYQQFNSSVLYATTHTNHGIHLIGLPLWIFGDGTATTSSNRYYDEDANTIECYILFAELLNVSGAMSDALYWWNYLVNTHWTNDYGGHFTYTANVGGTNFECEAGFFLKIIACLKYYNTNLANWTNVLTDIGNRFLSNEWNSYQWLNSGGSTTHVVVHEYMGNQEQRLTNTLGAWQSLLGVCLQLNNNYQNNMIDMLEGNANTQPAWQLLLNSGLFDSSTNLFRFYNDLYTTTDQNATAQGEILLFLMGIVPGTSTIAFPLEQLNYEYTQDIDPQLLQFNSRAHTITIPVEGAGSIAFQYGASPVTCVFDQSGIWQLTFSDSWNMITNVTCLTSLPTNRIYFAQLYPFNVNINAYDGSQGATVNVPISMDNSPTSNVTPYAFDNLTGTHRFAVPNIDEDGNTFKEWSTGETSPMITVGSGGTYTAYYGIIYTLNITTTEGGTTNPPPGLQFCEGVANVSVTAKPSSGYALDHWELDGQNTGSSNSTVITMNSDHDLHVVFSPIYSVVINAYCITEASDVSLPVLLDGSPTNCSTPNTFVVLNGTHAFAVPEVDTNGHPFRRWNTGQTETTISTNSTGTYIAYYGTSPLHDIAVTKIEPSKTIIAQNYTLTVVVTVENLGDYPETFNLTLYATSTEIGNVTVTEMPNGTSWSIIFRWNTTDSGYGNYTLKANASQVQGETDSSDNTLVQGNICVTILGDLNGDFKVSLLDLLILAYAYKSTPSDPRWNPNADIDGNGVVGLTDLVILAAHYGQQYP